MLAYSTLLNENLHGKFHDPASLARSIIFTNAASFPLSETLLLRCLDFRFSSEAGQLSFMHGILAAAPEARSVHDIANAMHNLDSFAEKVWSRETKAVTSAALRFCNTELLPTRLWPQGPWDSPDAVSALTDWYNASLQSWYNAVMRSATAIPPRPPPSPEYFVDVFSLSNHTFKNMLAGVHVRLLQSKRGRGSDRPTSSPGNHPSSTGSYSERRSARRRQRALPQISISRGVLYHTFVQAQPPIRPPGTTQVVSRVHHRRVRRSSQEPPHMTPGRTDQRRHRM